jgi:CcmD family protein
VKNLNSVFAAYLIAWGIFFVYYLTVARRAAQLKDELDSLKSSLRPSPGDARDRGK